MEVVKLLKMQQFMPNAADFLHTRDITMEYLANLDMRYAHTGNKFQTSEYHLVFETPHPFYTNVAQKRWMICPQSESNPQFFCDKKCSHSIACITVTFDKKLQLWHATARTHQIWHTKNLPEGNMILVSIHLEMLVFDMPCLMNCSFWKSNLYIERYCNFQKMQSCMPFAEQWGMDAPKLVK